MCLFFVTVIMLPCVTGHLQEPSVAIVIFRDIEISAFAAYEIHESAKGYVHTQQLWVANHHKIQTCTSHCHVKFTVDNHSVLLKYIVGQEIELVHLMDGETIDDIIPLATLIAFNGVNRYVVKDIYAVSVYCIPHSSNLIAIGNNDAYGHIFAEILLIE